MAARKSTTARLRTAEPPKVTAPEAEAAIPVKQQLRISPPNLREGWFAIQGIAPYVGHAFSAKQQLVMEETQRAGQQAKVRKTRTPKDFEQLYRDAQHVSEEGWLGIPASAFRNAVIDACRLVGFVMTRAKLSVFTIADGIDKNDGTPLVQIHGEVRPIKLPVRNDNGSADIRWRPMWSKWHARVVLEFDEDQLSLADLTNLLHRAGKQVGIGEGRPNSPNSNGLGWGRFEVVSGEAMVGAKPLVRSQ